MRDARWERVDYPEDGEVVRHEHGMNIWHEHVGGDAPHGHRHHARTQDNGDVIFTDRYYRRDES